MKTWKLAALAAGVLVLAGCGKGTPAPNNNETPQGAPTLKVSDSGSAASSVVNSIKDAMGLGKTMKCTYKITNKDGQLETVAYVNGQKFKTDMAIASDTQHMVSDGETFYSWSERTKQGMKMTKACSDELAKNAPKNSDTNMPALDPTGEKEFDGATDVKCEDASGVDFSVPTDITFADQCEMLKGLMQNKNVPDMKLPAGANIPKNLPGNIPNMNVSE